MADESHQPRPVPSLAPEPPVTDEDRDRYGRLLDRAAERGLIGPADYRDRLRDLAEATTIEELTRIVSELPAFSVPPAATRSGPLGRRHALGPGSVGLSRGLERRPNPWVLLAIVVVVMAASLVLLAVFVEHLAHIHRTGLPTGPAAVQTVSALRL
jgi:hypothetical protein